MADDFRELDSDDGGDFDREDDPNDDGSIDGSEREMIQARRSQQHQGAHGRNYEDNSTSTARSSPEADAQGRNYHANGVDDDSGVAGDSPTRNHKDNSIDNSNSTFQDNRPDVKFKHVGGDQDGQKVAGFKYKKPSISVKTQANFAEHDVFGDVTVRQKLGEKPDEISVEGICTAEEANDVDELVYHEVVELVSNRWSGVVHVASTSTNPISEGGGMDLDSDWIYSFTIECVEITESMNADEFDIEDILDMGTVDFIDQDGDGQLDLSEM